MSTLSLVGALWLPALTAPYLSPPPIRLFDLTTAHAIVDEKPFEPSRVFVPEDEVIFLWYAADGCAIGTTIRSTWLYLETDPPSRVIEGSVLVDREGTWGQFNFRLAPGRRWSLGRYRIELRIGDTLMADTEFVVVSARPTVLLQAGTGPRDRSSLHAKDRAVVAEGCRKTSAIRGTPVAET